MKTHRPQRPFAPILLLAAVVAACGGRQAGPQVEEPRPPAEPPRVEEPPAAVVIGAILPASGSSVLKQYGDLIREGIDIAMREHDAAGGRDVELVVLDDAGDAGQAPRLVGELERRNAVGIIGPLLGSALSAAADARTDSSTVLISPTATDRITKSNVYTLNASDARGAEALGAYAVRRAFPRIGMLYPRTAEFRAQAEAFRSAVVAAGARVTSDVPFDSGTTTFSRPLQQLRSAAVRAVFIPASERDIRQLAPQLEYYGLGDVQVLGSEAWVEDEVLRTVQPRLLEGVVAATPLFRSSDSVAWEHFVGLYEATYRRTLDNPYPALGYDAARLILSQLPSGRITRTQVARGLAGVTDFRGATGVLSARGGAISRRPFIVRIQGGRPVLANGPGS